MGGRLERGLDATKAAIREMWEPTAFFEALGVRYTGPFDGHDIAGLEEALRNAAEMAAARSVVHVLTEKGRGYAPAENDPIKRMHDIGAPKPGSYTAAFTEALIKEAEARPELVAITAAMPDSTGLLPFDERFPGRMFDVGIAEQHAVTSAAGMAMGGLRPVVALYSTFLTRAFDQVNLDVGLHGQPVVFCLDRAGITGDDGPSAPRRARHGAAHQGAGHDGVRPVVVPGAAARCSTTPWSITDGPVGHPLGQDRGPPGRRGRGRPRASTGRRLRSGDDVCLIGVGKMLGAAEAAAELLAADGMSVHRLGRPGGQAARPRACWPTPAATPYVITVEDGLRDGGVGMAVADRLCRDHRRPARAAGAGAGRPRRLHPPRQARRHPRRARPRRRRRLRLGRVADGRRSPPRRLGLTPP